MFKKWITAICSIFMKTEVTPKSSDEVIKELFDDIDILYEVNLKYNKSIRYTPDELQYGLKDFWQTPTETKKRGWGDCEDIAFCKYWDLLGVFDDLRLAHVTLPDGTAHMICMVGETVLDSMFDTLTSINSTKYKIVYSFNHDNARLHTSSGDYVDIPMKQMRTWSNLLERVRKKESS